MLCYFSNCPSYEKYTGTNFAEDCLYMNIYKPQNAQNLPIFIWIHGGGFVDGAAGEYSGDDLIKSGEIIFIAIQYRLGVFGFMDIPGLG